jgi:hypothetical protein
MFSWPRELFGALRELRGASRDLTKFVEAQPVVVPLADVEGLSSSRPERPLAVAIDPAGVQTLERARAAAANAAEVSLELELCAPPFQRGQTPTVLANLAKARVGRIEDEADVARWAAQAGLTLDGGRFTAAAILRHMPGRQPPFTLELTLPAREP